MAQEKRIVAGRHLEVAGHRRRRDLLGMCHLRQCNAERYAKRCDALDEAGGLRDVFLGSLIILHRFSFFVCVFRVSAGLLILVRRVCIDMRVTMRQDRARRRGTAAARVTRASAPIQSMCRRRSPQNGVAQRPRTRKYGEYCGYSDDRPRMMASSQPESTDSLT